MRRIALSLHSSDNTIRLLYASDSEPGIVRLRKGKGFVYTQQDRRVTDKETLERIRKIVIPPAWTRVWICASASGHIQATGYDTRNRKQYRYHSIWSQARNETKFDRLLEFGKTLPQLRAQLEQDLARPQLDERKVLATVVSLMERTYIRIGSSDYERLYGSYGLSTLKDQHVKIKGDTLRFAFKGKKGVYHEISLKNKRLARIVQQCRDIPGKELFQYYDADHQRHSIDSGQVNAYLKELCGDTYSTKDFRTWAGTLHALCILRELGQAETVTALKHNCVEALDYVSQKLGNTRTVCKKYYVHPLLLNLYEQNKLHPTLQKHEKAVSRNKDKGWSDEEKVLLKLLSSF